MDSSPGHLPQTSFSQPGRGLTFPDSKSSREKTGFAADESASVILTEVSVSLVIAKTHLPSYSNNRILLPSGEFSKPISSAHPPS
jgi:hypothetical protein